MEAMLSAEYCGMSVNCQMTRGTALILTLVRSRIQLDWQPSALGSTTCFMGMRINQEVMGGE